MMPREVRQQLAEQLPKELYVEWAQLSGGLQRTVENHVAAQEAFLVQVLREVRAESHKPCAPTTQPLSPSQVGNWVKAEYFYNVVTQESQWDVPEDFGSAEVADAHLLLESLDKRSCGAGASCTEESWERRTPAAQFDTWCEADRESSAIERVDSKINNGHLKGKKGQSESSASLTKGATSRDLQLQDFLEDMETKYGEDAMQMRIAKQVARWSEWWSHLREPERKGPLAAVVNSAVFEGICSAAIVVYSVFMLQAADYTVKHLTEKPTPSMVISERFFFFFFIAEVVLRLMVHRLYFFCNDDMNWNMFDLVLVAFSVYENILSIVLVEGSGADINLTFMRSMRLMKMVKALRVLKMMRFVSELRFMINSVMGSFVSLFWCGVMLVMMFFLFSLAFVQGVAGYLIHAQGSIDDAQQKMLMEAFGSVRLSMLSCFRCVTGGDDWGVFYDLLEPTGVMNIAMFVFFVMFSEIALLNIVTGVFVENAMKLGQPELAALAFEQRKRDLADAASLREVFERIDLDGSGTISCKEFNERVQHDERVKARLSVLGLDIKDTSMFFDMLMDVGHDIEIDIDFFVDACLKMKGTASSIDLQGVAFEAKVIHQNLRHFEKETREMFKAVIKLMDMKTADLVLKEASQECVPSIQRIAEEQVGSCQRDTE